jgi:DNA-binding IclR family transcriptional regulator
LADKKTKTMSKQTEKEIIQFLDRNGPSLLGEVVKELKLSYSKGHEYINRLLRKGKVRHSDPPVHFEINSGSK